MQLMKIRLVSLAPMLMHSDRGADPLDPLVKQKKELTNSNTKNQKTDSKTIQIAKIDFLLGMYHNGETPYLPGHVLEASIINAAKLSKKGTIAKRAFRIQEDELPLIYEGPKDTEGLWEDKHFVDARTVRQMAARIVRYRPRFNAWEAEATIMYDEEQLNEKDILQFLEEAGRMMGVGDFRPRFGTFTAKKV